MIKNMRKMIKKMWKMIKKIVVHKMPFNCASKMTSFSNISHQIETFFHPLQIQIRSRCLSEHTRNSRSPREHDEKCWKSGGNLNLRSRDSNFFFRSSTFAGKVVAMLSIWRGKRVLEFCWLEFLAKVIFVWFITLLRYRALRDGNLKP